MKKRNFVGISLLRYCCCCGDLASIKHTDIGHLAHGIPNRRIDSINGLLLIYRGPATAQLAWLLHIRQGMGLERLVVGAVCLGLNTVVSIEL